MQLWNLIFLCKHPQLSRLIQVLDDSQNLATGTVSETLLNKTWSTATETRKRATLGAKAETLRQPTCTSNTSQASLKVLRTLIKRISSTRGHIRVGTTFRHQLVLLSDMENFHPMTKWLWKTSLVQLGRLPSQWTLSVTPLCFTGKNLDHFLITLTNSSISDNQFWNLQRPEL